MQQRHSHSAAGVIAPVPENRCICYFISRVETGEMMEKATMYAYDALDVQVRCLMECAVYLSAS